MRMRILQGAHQGFQKQPGRTRKTILRTIKFDNWTQTMGNAAKYLMLRKSIGIETDDFNRNKFGIRFPRNFFFFFFASKDVLLKHHC